MEEKTFIVYRHTSPNGKVYVGITCHKPSVRWKKDGKGYKNNVHFWGAIQMYGWDNFTHEILYEGLSEQEACQKEVELIDFYKSNRKEFGYNIASGGIINFPSDETKEKISRANKGKKWSEEQKARIAGRHVGRIMSDESRAKMSISHTGRKHSAETKLKISKANSGRKFSDEHKEKLRRSKIGSKRSQESIEKSRIAATGKKHTEETKKKIAESKYKKIICTTTGIVYSSATEASKILGIPRTTICSCLTGRSKNPRKLSFDYFIQEGTDL